MGIVTIYDIFKHFKFSIVVVFFYIMEGIEFIGKKYLTVAAYRDVKVVKLTHVVLTSLQGRNKLLRAHPLHVY